jgi:phage gpG-like protein
MFELNLQGQNVAVVLKWTKELEAAILAAGFVGMKRGLERAVTTAQREYLSGPRPEKLDVRTTRLRGSITSEVATPDPERGVVGKAGTNLAYGAFHEFGLRGTVNVEAHTRVVKEMNKLGVEVDSRRQLKNKKGELIGFKESRTKSSARAKTQATTQQVQAHQRTLNYAGRPFMRPAIQDSLPIILNEIQEEIEKGIKQ